MNSGKRFKESVLAAQETAMLNMNKELQQLRRTNEKLKKQNEKILKDKDKIIENLEVELFEILKDAQDKCKKAIDSAIKSFKADTAPNNQDEEIEVKRLMVLGLRNRSANEILKFLAAYPGKSFRKVVIATLTGYNVLNDAFTLGLTELITNSLIDYQDGYYSYKSDIDVSPLGIAGAASKKIDSFFSNLSKCEREIAELLWASPDKKWTLEGLAKKTPSGYKALSGGFNKALAKLKSLEFLNREDNVILLNPELSAFLEPDR